MEEEPERPVGIFEGGYAGTGGRALVRVVFFGTPEFAVPSLRALVGAGFGVVAVVPHPDAPQGRPRSSPVPPPVKIAAQAEELTIFQPEKPTDGAFVLRLRDLRPD